MRWMTIVVPMALLAIGCNNAITDRPPPTGVGPAGGRVESADGRAVLVIPANALTATVDITVTRETGLPLDAAITDNWYRIGPASLEFQQPAQLTVRFNPDRGPAGARNGDFQLASIANGTVTPGGGTRVADTVIALGLRGSGTLGVYWQPATACASLERTQFDFWIGRWRFESPGQPAGDQTVTKVGSNCGIREAFTQGTYRGSSISLYSETDSRWRQTYIDTDGARRILTGQFAAGVMVLNETATQRFLWKPEGANVVRFTGEQSSDGGTTWRQFFTSTYTKVP